MSTRNIQSHTEEIYGLKFSPVAVSNITDSITCLGIDINGNKDMPGIWIGEAESAKFRMSVLNELSNRRG